MNIKHLFIIIIFSVSSLTAMDKENKEVEAFRLQLEQDWNNKPNKQMELNKNTYNTIQKLCSARIQKKKKIQDPQEWYKQINRICTKLKDYNGHEDLCPTINNTIADAIDCLEKILVGLQAVKILNQKQLQLAVQGKVLALAALERATKMVHTVNQFKLRVLKHARLQLRKKSFGPKVQQYVRKCSCCKKEVVIKCIIRK